MQVSAMGQGECPLGAARVEPLVELDRQVRNTEEALPITYTPRARWCGKKHLVRLHQLIAAALKRQAEIVEAECHLHISDIWQRSAKDELRTKPGQV